eukprot:13298443-Ditylum_brightwellii.AAC.1
MDEEEELESTSEVRGNAEKTSNLNHNPQESDNNTRMESSIRKKEQPKIHQANKEDSTTNCSSYYGPTSHEEEIASSYIRYSGLKSNSSDVEIVMKPSI